MADSFLTLAQLIKQWGHDEGFNQVGISDVDLSAHHNHLERWLDKHYHGEMEYMQRHSDLRKAPEKLQSGVLRSISFRMDYRHLAESNDELTTLLQTPEKAYISRYALGRDYHKLIRKKLAQIAKRIEEHAELNLNQRAFVDSAPVLERALAEKAGLGWIGKNTMLINKNAGSWFFLGEILTDLELPTDPVEPNIHCGSCEACMPACPTDAIIGPNQLDARKCISYLTIELKEAIPVELRSKIGNRIFGCDDCQIVCPWNKFSEPSTVDDFKPRHKLENSDLLVLFNWSEEEFLKNTEGSPIRRIGYERWLRNIAVALGNGEPSETALNALKEKAAYPSKLVREHSQWAIKQLGENITSQNNGLP